LPTWKINDNDVDDSYLFTTNRNNQSVYYLNVPHTAYAGDNKQYNVSCSTATVTAKFIVDIRSCPNPANQHDNYPVIQVQKIQ